MPRQLRRALPVRGHIHFEQRPEQGGRAPLFRHRCRRSHGRRLGAQERPVQGTEAAAYGHAEWRSRSLIGGDPTERLYFDIVAVARFGPAGQESPLPIVSCGGGAGRRLRRYRLRMKPISA